MSSCSSKVKRISSRAKHIGVVAACITLTLITPTIVNARTPGINPGATTPGINPGATTPGSTSTPGSTTGGGGIQGSIQDWIQQALGPVQGYIGQLDELKESLTGRLRDFLNNDLLGSINESLDNVMGALNLPDPTAILDGIEEAIGREGDQAGVNTVHQVNPTIATRGIVSVVNVETARISAAGILSEDGQQSMRDELTNLGQGVSAGGELATGSTTLSQQSSQAAEQSTQVAQLASDTAQQAQSRVSTQDAIKDLNSIQALVSTQINGLSSQSAAQSGQLANIANQNATALQLDAASLFREGQQVTALAAANQNLADMNEQMRGEAQAEIIRNNASVARQVQLNSSGYRLMR
jgi:hypothetical protein